MDNKLETISVANPPLHLQKAYDALFTVNALEFITQLVTTFEDKVEKLYWSRLKKKSEFYLKNVIPTFPDTAERRDPVWRIRSLPSRLLNRQLDLGDVSPSNTTHFILSLNAQVQGVQVDFDDGHCPTWQNQILGLYNVCQAVHGKLHGVQSVEKLPVLMLRPRAWNMTEYNIFVNGKAAPGPLIDFGLLMYHNANILAELCCGPYFYLSKLENATEARLWNDIFIWTQNKLQLPTGTIKACVLIENIFAAFEMEEILYQLKDHCIGLNCGIWDYTASIICNFGDNSKYIFPDRNKYVNVEKYFLQKYMQLLVDTCHARGALATGGMTPLLITSELPVENINKALELKKQEIFAGFDGFLVYDMKFLSQMNKLWKDIGQNFLVQPMSTGAVMPTDLLKIPPGGTTFEGLKHNIEVALLFIYNWLKGNGHFFYKGAVEDSATAEISRLQVWQGIRHQITIDDKLIISKELVQKLVTAFLQTEIPSTLLKTASELFIEIITAKHPPSFITSYLNEHYIFKQMQMIIKHKL
ncbi:hypothetical protein FQA39_LY18224 [Lamprigera yunnana]|nr:hypothetical protein FQA39_LY18224 [Lamprigera yunnana]